MKSYMPDSCLVAGLTVVLLAFTATVYADEIPVNETLTAGDTLYVRFQLTDMGLFPDPFNSVGTRFMFAGAAANLTWRVDLYDDDDATVVGTYGPQFSANALGLGPTYVDTSMGGGPASGGSRVPGDLSSYLDGNGMAAFTIVSGPDVTVSTFEPLFGYHSGSVGYSPLIPHVQTYAINQLPGPIPEPAGVLLIGLGSVLLIQRR